jgi:hypothetical protein
MGAKNKVIAGDYEGRPVKSILGTIHIATLDLKPRIIDKTTVESYELVTDEHRKSAASGATRGLVGSLLLGAPGLIAGALSAKSKGIYTIAIQFKDGKRSMIEVDDKIYKSIIKKCF